MGKVYLSFHSGLGIPVAVKILKPHLIEEDPEFLDRFIQEGRLAVSLHHKNIVRIFDAGKAGESYYLIMELLEGNDALHIIEQEGGFSPEKTLEVGCAVTDALTDAHEHGVIHRDIKPDNIMITSEGKIKLADLGLAKKLGDEFSSTMAGTTIGTPNYMSPEQAMNSSEADVRSDIYSLGATLYHMLTGTLPFDGESIMSVMMKHANEPLEPPQSRKEGLPSNLCSVIIKMMEKDPNKRFQNCDEVLTALNKIRYAPTESEKPKTNVLKTKKFKKPSKKTDAVKAKREEEISKKEPKKFKPILISFITALILIPILVFILKPKQINISEKNKTKTGFQSSGQTDPAKEKQAIKTTLPDKTTVTTPKQLPVKNLLENYKISKKLTGTVTYKQGILEIKQRDHFYQKVFKGVFENYKLTIEYKFSNPQGYAKIGLLRNKEQTTNFTIASSSHKKLTTGDIQLKTGINPDFKYTNVYRAKVKNNNPIGEWNTLEIILDGNSLNASVNGKLVTVFTTIHNNGGLAVLVEPKSHLLIGKLEVVPLK